MASTFGDWDDVVGHGGGSLTAVATELIALEDVVSHSGGEPPAMATMPRDTCVRGAWLGVGAAGGGADAGGARHG